MVEDPAGGNFLTSYVYDTVDDLITVTQGTGANPLPNRTFTYETLKRLITAFNPESGATCYGTYNYGSSLCTESYDKNGNLLSKVDVEQGVVTAYNYDSLNRLTGKSYFPQKLSARSFALIAGI